MNKISHIFGVIFVGLTLSLVGIGHTTLSHAREFVTIKGSDSMVQLVRTWSEGFHQDHPDACVAIMGGGTDTGFAALLNGEVMMATSSRALTEKEKWLAKHKALDLKEHVVAYDAKIAVIVNRQNPIPYLTIDMLAEIYGEGPTLTHWHQLGVEVSGCPDQTITVASRQSSSGTYYHFRKWILGDQRNYRMNMLELPRAKNIVEFVEKNPCAIGYNGASAVTKDIRTICITEKNDNSCIGADQDLQGDRINHHLSRPLFMVTVGKPEGGMRSFLDWVLGVKGQCIAKKQGYSMIGNFDCQEL